MTQGTMDFDYRKRCAVVVDAMTDDMPEHQVIYYGLTSRELGRWDAEDLSGYAELSARGRRPGQAHGVSKHFFNKRIMTDDERIGLATVQAGRDEARVRARYGVGGASRAEEAEAEIARWERARRGDQSTGEEGNKERVTT